MCCSTLSTKGGMVSVVKNYLGYLGWDEYRVTYVPTHFDCRCKALTVFYFMVRYIQLFVMALLGNYKIAHLHVASYGSFWRKSLLMWTFKRIGLKVVMHHHQACFEEFYDCCTLRQKKLIDKVLCDADLNIVLSDRLRSMFEEKAPCASFKVLYNAVSTYDVNPYKENGDVILFLGRLGKRKGTYDLLECIKRLDKLIPDSLKFCLCGDGEIDKVNKFIASENIGHRIFHVGWIDGKLKNSLLERALINVLPSYNEGLPMTILETMARGIPNISTKVASIPEVIVDGKNGFLIAPGDLDSLCDRMLRLIRSEILRKKFSDESFHLISEHFSLDSHMEKLKSSYRGLLE